MATLTSRSAFADFGKSGRIAVDTIEVAETPFEDIETKIPSTIDELISLRALQKGNDQPIVAYPNEGTDYVDWTPSQLHRLVEQAAIKYSDIIPQRVSSDDPVQVVGLLGNSDLEYLVAFLAVSRLGHSALLLSTRITDEALESLLTSTSGSALLYQHTFSASVTRLSKSLPALKTGNIFAPSLSCTSNRSSLMPTSLDPVRETNNICFIIHSSGSTGLPKPIYQTHRAALYTYSQNFGLVGHITLPLYHNHGICCLFRAIHSRQKIYIYNARLPLASKHLLATLTEHPEIRILYGVPYALKLLSETEEGLSLLSDLDIVMFGGSACPKPIGDRLVDAGVNLVGHYGATEVGQLMTSFRDHREDKGWEWMRVPSHLKPYLSMEPRGPNLYECCVKSGWGSKVATNRDDGSYATKDLFEPHPTIADAWKYYARLDDTITLENGEKANPLLVEGVIRQDHNVAEVVVFGAGKLCLGAFIVPAENSDLQDSQIVDAVMPKIEEMNAKMPAYSQLSREMVKVLPRDVDYRRTDKGTVIRAAFYRDFSAQIDAAYVDQQSGTLVMAREHLLEFLQKEVQKRVTLKHTAALDEHADLFSLGVDSLQAIQIRSFILQHLKLDGEKLGRNFVFDFPTLGKMTDEIIRLQSGGPERDLMGIEDQMSAMVEKYAKFPQHVPVDNTVVGKHIVVTGATGSLGAHVVANLVSQPSVHKVYCLVRASSKRDAQSRVRGSLRERLTYHSLTLSARSKIVALPSNFSDPKLGLEQSEYDEVSASITHMIHLAWSVNFNKGLESFEADCIVGAKNLMNLCLAAKQPEPASFNFCSSVSATAATPGPVVPEALPASLTYAQGMGYAQSKLVAEHLCDRASQQTGLKARVLRVGQIIGDTQHGMWNATEAIPLMFQTARTIGALPELDETPYWLPVDIVAKACSEIACSAAESGVMNIVNDESFHWSRDLLPLLKDAGLSFETVSQQEWVRRLRASEADPTKNPPIKLVDFFASKYDNNKPRRSLAYATTRAQGFSPSLQNAGVIGRTIVDKIVSQLVKRWSTAMDSHSRPVVIIIGGPCGSGKSTVARALAATFDLPVVEGDDMHSKGAVQNMSSGIPFTDEDRLSWLAHIRGAVIDRLNTTQKPAILVTCSALRSIHRYELRALEDIADVKTLFIMLETESRDELKSRVSERQNHYMAPAMVDAQVDLLETAKDDEIDIVPVDATMPLETAVEECRSILADIVDR